MAVVKLYVPDSVPVSSFLSFAHETNLVVLERGSHPLPEHYARIAHSDTCACPDRIIVKRNSVVVPAVQDRVMGYGGYGIEELCSDEEWVTLVTWITRHQFYSFHTCIREGSLQRFLSPFHIFKKEKHPSCILCEQHVLESDPVFCLKNEVVSQRNRGPTVESVL